MDDKVIDQKVNELLEEFGLYELNVIIREGVEQAISIFTQDMLKTRSYDVFPNHQARDVYVNNVGGFK